MQRGRDFVGYGESGAGVQWPHRVKLPVSVVVNYEEGSERSLPGGDDEQEVMTEWGSYPFPEGVRNLAMESMYEYGSRVGVWRIVRALRERRLAATFFATAMALEENPQVAQAIVRDGHEVCSHGYRWEEVFTLSRDEEAAHIGKAIRSIETRTGRRPSGWYCRYGPSIHTRDLLLEEGGFLYDSDSYNDDTPYTVTRNGHQHVIIPYSPDANDFRFWQSNGPVNASQFYEYLIDTFDVLYAEARETPRVMSVGLHCRIIGRPGRIAALTRFLDYALAHEGVWFATRRDIARAWLECLGSGGLDAHRVAAEVPRESGHPPA